VKLVLTHTGITVDIRYHNWTAWVLMGTG